MVVEIPLCSVIFTHRRAYPLLDGCLWVFFFFLVFFTSVFRQTLCAVGTTHDVILLSFSKVFG